MWPTRTKRAALLWYMGTATGIHPQVGLNIFGLADDITPQLSFNKLGYTG